MMTSKTSDAIRPSNEQEEALLRRIAGQHRPSFEKLFGSYHPRIFRFVFRLTRSYSAADELANDVLLTVWQNAEQFRAESKVSTWIFGIAYRQSLRYLRKRKPDTVPLFDRDALAHDANSDFERQNWVQHGIQQLPPKQKLTVMLVYYLGLSCEETAVVTDSPVSTVKTRMFHARRKMKDYLAKSAVPTAATEADGYE
jgi:RNA polymerase sigma-70 factor (ECF subfamily)